MPPSRPAAARPPATALTRVIGVVACVLGVGLILPVGWGAWRVNAPRHESEVIARQAAFLDQALAEGAADQMQALFPEGAYFQITLTALVDAADTSRPVEERARLLDEHIAALDEPAMDAHFAPSDAIFPRGWRLLVLVERLRLVPDADLEARVRAECTDIMADVEASPTGVLSSYPGGYWPVDTVVALAAVARADATVGVDGAAAGIAAWQEKVAPLRDANGLLVHRTAEDGTPIDSARGSSQSIIQVFWPDLDPAGAPAEWQRFHAAFVDRQAGLVGVREYPRGDQRSGDIDSGPLILGVSASASAVTLGAARRAGALDLARGLDAEAEVLGLGWDTATHRRYAGGLMPIGDAFLAWSRTQPLAPAQTDADGPSPRWWAWALGLGTPGALALLGGLRLTFRRRPGVR
ncbi:MAG: hypothetical protein ACK5LS_00220 [Propioniciclava sp.]